MDKWQLFQGSCASVCGAGFCQAKPRGAVPGSASLVPLAWSWHGLRSSAGERCHLKLWDAPLCVTQAWQALPFLGCTSVLPSRPVTARDHCTRAQSGLLHCSSQEGVPRCALHLVQSQRDSLLSSHLCGGIHQLGAADVGTAGAGTP